jgi:hypothetical protein
MNDGALYFFKNQSKEGIEKADYSRHDDFRGIEGNEIKYFEENEEILKPILILLEKAEQILSILNLSDNTVRKYNQLKELTFEKLHLKFNPLTKENSITNIANTNSRYPNSNLDNIWSIIIKERNLNVRKNQIIEFLIELIEKFVFENAFSCGKSGLTNSGSVQYLKKFLNEKENFLNQQYEKLLTDQYNFKTDSNMANLKNLDDLEFEIKMEEIKIKEYLNKSEMSYKKFLSNLNIKHSIQIKSSKENKEEDINSIIIINELENKIEEIKEFHQIELQEFREKFQELRAKYNPEVENEIYKLKGDFEETRFILEKINEMIHPFYEKYYFKNSSWYQNDKIEFKFRELEEINFLICLTNKFFNDNKYLIELVSTLQKEKSGLMEERNLPMVANTIDKNNLILEISEDYKNLENNSNSLYNNFKELIEYINHNFENI